ncbi:MAG: ComEC/Rec2 family competence protein [Vicinamibacterales bacterium]
MTATRIVVLALLVLTPATLAARSLDIYFIDVEGGQATLIVTPAGESLLIDAGYGRDSRDPDRILAAVRDAGLERLDVLLVTHFHNDHVGGVPELAARIPIRTFIDYGDPLGTPYGADRMTLRSFALYEPVRKAGLHLTPQPGERLPLAGVDATVVSSGGTLLSTPLPGGGQPNAACGSLAHHPEDGTENFRSLGIVLRYGAFGFLDVGDLSGNTLPKLFCPQNLVGEVSVYLIAHHGNYDSDASAVYSALNPRVAVMNNGPAKGGDPSTFRTVRVQPSVDLWQLHASRHPEAQNSADDLIANVDDQEHEGHWIKLTASDDGSFQVTNGRTGHTRTYAAESTHGRH